MKRLLWTALLSVAAALCFWGSHRTALFDTDEPRYAQAAREMMLRGDWVLPTFNGQPRYAKPVLFYWLLIIAYRLFGINEFAARFWSGVAALVLAGSVWAMVRHALGADAAYIAAMAWLTMLGTQLFAHAAITDMVLTAFMAGGIAALWSALTTGHTAWLYAAATAMGLAVLTKGPVGIALPVCIVVVTALIVGRRALCVPHWRVVLGAAVLFVLIVAPWYVAVTVRTQGEFLRQFLFAENVHRYAGGSKLPLLVHIVYYPVTAFALAAPWSALAVWRLRPPSDTDEQVAVAWQWLWRVWAVLPIFVFTLSHTKNPQYVLLSVPAVAALVGEWGANATPSQERWGKFAWGAVAVVGAVISAVAPFALNAVADWRLRFSGGETVSFGWGTNALAGLAAALAAVSLLPRRQMVLASVALLCVWHAIAFATLVPIIGAYRQDPLKHFAQQAARQLRPEDVLIVYRRDLSSVVFYSGRRVVRIDSAKQLAPLLASFQRVDVLTHVRFLPDLRGLPLHLVERQRGAVWLSNRPVRCPQHARAP